MQNDILFLASNLALVDEVYEKYRRDPSAVDPAWRRLFEAESKAEGSSVYKGASPLVGGTPTSLPASSVLPVPVTAKTNGTNGNGSNGTHFDPAQYSGVSTLPVTNALFLAKVWALIHSFRSRGHLEADLDPLGMIKAIPH